MSWQYQSGKMWLRDFLPSGVPNARVFTYGYPSKLRESASNARLADYTDAFLREVDALSSQNTLSVRFWRLPDSAFRGMQLMTIC